MLGWASSIALVLSLGNCRVGQSFSSSCPQPQAELPSSALASSRMAAMSKVGAILLLSSPQGRSSFTWTARDSSTVLPKQGEGWGEGGGSPECCRWWGAGTALLLSCWHFWPWGQLSYLPQAATVPPPTPPYGRWETGPDFPCSCSQSWLTHTPVSAQESGKAGPAPHLAS